MRLKREVLKEEGIHGTLRPTCISLVSPSATVVIRTQAKTICLWNAAICS